MDGAQVNGDFINMLLKGKCPATAHCSVKNIWYPSYPNVTLMMDYSHVINTHDGLLPCY